MSDVSNSFSAWETLLEHEPPLCIAVRRPESPPRYYEAYDVIGLTETRRRHPLNAVYDTGEELFLGICDCREVGVLVNTDMVVNIDSFEQLTTRVGRLRMRRCGPTPALKIFFAYAPTPSYEGVEAFYRDLEKFCKEDHTFYKVIIGDFNATIGLRNPRKMPDQNT
ncbi:hypothetical protein RB195_022526 [Necator americanus]|uniref:Endonuclease/exonuclease/phosphatase domain-containing protein n=1 Tax=Necator americanus TaxID=51031 RepID=A0ABR1EFV7_NECAM